MMEMAANMRTNKNPLIIQTKIYAAVHDLIVGALPINFDDDMLKAANRKADKYYYNIINAIDQLVEKKLKRLEEKEGS